MPTRRAMLADARGGGSITPQSFATLQRIREKLGLEHVDNNDSDSDSDNDSAEQEQEPMVTVEENMEVEAAMWIDAPDSSTGKACWEVYFQDGSQREYDWIWLATGAVLRVQEDPLLGGVLKEWPIDTEQGMCVHACACVCMRVHACCVLVGLSVGWCCIVCCRKSCS